MTIIFKILFCVFPCSFWNSNYTCRQIDISNSATRHAYLLFSLISLCVSFWIGFISISLSSLIFSFSMFNLLLIPYCVFYIYDISFFISKLPCGFFHSSTQKYLSFLFCVVHIFIYILDYVYNI